MIAIFAIGSVLFWGSVTAAAYKSAMHDKPERIPNMEHGYEPDF
jgi:hypothetical protein